MNTLLRLAAVCSFAALPAQTTVTEQSVLTAEDWRGALIHRATSGVWYARVEQVVDDYGPPEAIVADDEGRLTVLSVYSGNWTARSVDPDHQWLAPSRPADVDPRVPGKEIYAGGRAGNVHRVRIVTEAAAGFRLESVEIAHVAGEEFHTIVAADLQPARAGDELLAFGITGAVFRLEPALRDDDPSGSAFALHRVATLPGRVRDAVLVPGSAAMSPRLLGVSRSGDVLAMTLADDGLHWQVLAHEAMGLGRIALRPVADGDAGVLYVTRDDGVLLRLAIGRDGTLAREVILAGDQGLRGVAAGTFFDDPAREAVAVYGYNARVQLVSRAGAGPWQVETIFASEDRGHWLTVGELDGRNGTDELLATGFGGQVVLLARPPGYALPGAAVPDELRSSRLPARTPK
ncbi:MAG: hypothetical protein IPM29_02270 [Planctomycetes bacterium]|nr:hypothetical protein [Planctomycetota bacterium]